MRRSIRDGLRFRVLKRDRFRCRYCGAHGSEVELHIDHVQPVSAGGTNHPSNLVTACRRCNLGKHAEPPLWAPCTDTRGGYGCDLYIRNQFLAAGRAVSERLSRESESDAFWLKAIPIERQLHALWGNNGLGMQQCNAGDYGWWRADMFSALCGAGQCCSGDA